MTMVLISWIALALVLVPTGLPATSDSPSSLLFPWLEPLFYNNDFEQMYGWVLISGQFMRMNGETVRGYIVVYQWG